MNSTPSLVSASPGPGRTNELGGQMLLIRVLDCRASRRKACGQVCLCECGFFQVLTLLSLLKHTCP